MRVEAQEQVYPVNPVQSRPETAKPVETKPELKKPEQLASQAGKPVTKEVLQSAVDLANKVMEIADRHLVFRLHEKSGRYQVKVVEQGPNGDKIIREIPSDKMLELSAELRDKMEQATGLLLNELV